MASKFGLLDDYLEEEAVQAPKKKAEEKKSEEKEVTTPAAVEEKPKKEAPATRRTPQRKTPAKKEEPVAEEKKQRGRPKLRESYVRVGFQCEENLYNQIKEIVDEKYAGNMTYFLNKLIEKHGSEM